MHKTTWLAVLVCVNLILLTGLILVGTGPRTALAQPTGLSGNYLVVAGETQTGVDALYLIDLKERTLHMFYFDRGTKKLEWGGYRNLELDFRHNRENP